MFLFAPFLIIVSLVGVKLQCSENGVSLGKLQGDGGINGEVFVVNSSWIHIVGFSATPPAGQKLNFWFDSPSDSGKVKNVYQWETNKAYLKPISSDLVAYSNVHLVLNVPGNKIKDYKSFGIYSDGQKKSYASVNIPSDLKVPQEISLGVGLKGWIYNVQSGPVVLLSSKSILIPNFQFQGDKPPDGWVFVGKYKQDQVDGATKDKVDKNGFKALIRGRDTKEKQEAMHERWDGDKSIIADLPDGITVCDSEYLSIYCFAVGVDFGNMDLRKKITGPLPPYIPPVASDGTV